MWTHPGKKLLFMGSELAQEREWNHDAEVAWDLLDSREHASVQRLVRDLNVLYGEEPALHASDADQTAFEWLVGDDSDNSVYVYARRSDGAPTIVVALNMTPEARYGYEVSLPQTGTWREVLNSDASIYGGTNIGNGGTVHASTPDGPQPGGRAGLVIPPLGAVILREET
jgi:1,4-alpha-glucan branching enzyme